MFSLRYLCLSMDTGVHKDFHIRSCLCSLTVTRRVPLVEMELISPPQHPDSFRLLWDLCYSSFFVLHFVDHCLVLLFCLFVLFVCLFGWCFFFGGGVLYLLTIISVLRITASGCSLLSSIFLFPIENPTRTWLNTGDCFMHIVFRCLYYFCEKSTMSGSMKLSYDNKHRPFS